MKFHLAVLLLAAVVHYVYAQYIIAGYPDDLSDDIGEDDGEIQGYDDVPLAAVPATAAIPYSASVPYSAAAIQAYASAPSVQSYGNVPVASVAGLQSYDSQYTLIPVQVVPVGYDDAPTYHREVRSKKKKKKGKKKKGWGWGWPKIKHIWLKAPKFHAHPPVIHIHPQPKHHVHKVVHHGWGWGHGGGGGGGGGYGR